MGRLSGSQVRVSLSLSLFNYISLFLFSGSADAVVVLTQPHDLVTMTTGGHPYPDDVVALL